MSEEHQKEFIKNLIKQCAEMNSKQGLTMETSQEKRELEEALAAIAVLEEKNKAMEDETMKMMELVREMMLFKGFSLEISARAQGLMMEMKKRRDEK